MSEIAVAIQKCSSCYISDQLRKCISTSDQFFISLLSFYLPAKAAFPYHQSFPGISDLINNIHMYGLFLSKLATEQEISVH